MNMSKRLLIEWISEGECGFFRIYDRKTGADIHCNESQVNDVIYELLGE